MGPGGVVVLVRVLLRIGDVDLVAEDLDAEGGVALGQAWVGKRPGGQHGGVEVRAVDFHLAGAEVGDVEPGHAAGVGGDGHALVDRPVSRTGGGGVVHGDDGVGADAARAVKRPGGVDAGVPADD